jgi:hypothetical protein
MTFVRNAGRLNMTDKESLQLVQRLRQRADACFNHEGAQIYTAEDAELDREAAEEIEFLRSITGNVSRGPGLRDMKKERSHG